MIDVTTKSSSLAELGIEVGIVGQSKNFGTISVDLLDFRSADDLSDFGGVDVVSVFVDAVESFSVTLVSGGAANTFLTGSAQSSNMEGGGFGTCCFGTGGEVH